MLNAIQKSRSKRNRKILFESNYCNGEHDPEGVWNLPQPTQRPKSQGPKHSVQIGKKSWGQKKNIQLSNSILKIKELHKAARWCAHRVTLMFKCRLAFIVGEDPSQPHGEPKRTCGGPATVGLLNSRSIGQNMSDPQALANFTHTQLALVW